MHEWMIDYWLQLYRQGLWTQLRPTSTSSPPLLSLQTDWTWFFTYLHMSLLVPGNSSFHFWIYILSCRHKSSFQDCCGKSNALDNFWNWHIHPHLVSRNENPDQGRGRSKDRGLQTGDSLHLCATWCSQYLDFPLLQNFPCSEAWCENQFWPTLCTHKTVAKLSRHNAHWLQKWLSSFSPPCVHTLGWG